MEPWIMITIWAVLIIVFLVIEFFSCQMVSIWFAGGSLIGLILGIWTEHIYWWIQVIVVIAVSAVLVLATRPLLRRYFDKNEVRLNADGLVGKEFELLTGIGGGSKEGTMQIGDIVWNAYAKEEINSGEIVRIIRVDGSKLTVEKIKGE